MELAGRSPRAVTTLTEWAIEELRRRIVMGELRAGAHVPLDLLAEELGVSRVPLREAVRRLEAEGLIVNVPRRGAVVTPLDLNDVEDAYQMLEVAEMIAIERAAASADTTSTEQMHYWLDAMRSALHEPVSEEMLIAHRAFHFSLFNGVGEGVLLRHLAMLWNTCERYVMASMPDHRRAKDALHEHEQLVHYIERGDAQGACEHLRRHLRSSLQSVKRKLQAQDVADAGESATGGDLVPGKG